MQDGQRLYISYGKKVSARHFTTLHLRACRVVHMQNCRCFGVFVAHVFVVGAPTKRLLHSRLCVQIVQPHFGGTRARNSPVRMLTGMNVLVPGR
jgi:hypothetical protein